MGVLDVAIGVGLTFVVSYAATGCFVWFLLWVAERELEPEEAPSAEVHLESEPATASDEAVAAADTQAEGPGHGEEEGA